MDPSVRIKLRSMFDDGLVGALAVLQVLWVPAVRSHARNSIHNIQPAPSLASHVMPASASIYVLLKRCSTAFEARHQTAGIQQAGSCELGSTGHQEHFKVHTTAAAAEPCGLGTLHIS